LFRPSRAASLLTGLIVGTLSGQAVARPQASSAVALGIAANGDRDDLWSGTRFAAGLRGDVLEWRERDADFGFGPYVEVLTTSSFHDLELGAGASLLIPVHPYLPVVASLGPYMRDTSAWGWEPGLSGSLFWGSRSFNYHSWYGLSAGLVLGGRYGLGPSHEVSTTLSVALDLELVALPFIVLWEALRHD
jgi:hypothetical protein